MRAIPRPLALRTAFAPIETIVFVFVLTTLAYFRILSVIRHSTYSALSAPNTLRPAYALLTDQEWVSVSEQDWFNARTHPQHGYTPIELQSIVFSVDGAQGHKVCRTRLDPHSFCVFMFHYRIRLSRIPRLYLPPSITSPTILLVNLPPPLAMRTLPSVMIRSRTIPFLLGKHAISTLLLRFRARRL
jgi:hypothetical protein